MLDQIMVWVAFYRQLTIFFPQKGPEFFEQHREVVQWMIEGDPESAELAITRHIDQSLLFGIKKLQEDGHE